MKALDMDIVEMSKKQVTLRVKVRRLKEFRFRLWLVLQILKLVAIVAPLRVEIEDQCHK